MARRNWFPTKPTCEKMPRKTRGIESRFLCYQKIVFYGPCRTRECTQPSFSSIEDWTAQLKWPSCWSHSIKTNLSEKRSGIVPFTSFEEKYSTAELQLRSRAVQRDRMQDKTRPPIQSIPPQISGRTPFSGVDCRTALFVPDPRTILRRRFRRS